MKRRFDSSFGSLGPDDSLYDYSKESIEELKKSVKKE